MNMRSGFAMDFGFADLLKKIAPFLGAGLVALGILAFLILPNRQTNVEICNELGLGGSIKSSQCETTFDEIIFVVGDTANSPKPTITQGNYLELAYNKNSINSGVYTISVSDPSSTPTKISTKNNSLSAQDANKKIQKMSATRDGADYLEAIRTAANHNPEVKTLIYVIGSGLSDKGLLNFASNSNYLSQDFNSKEFSTKLADFIIKQGDGDLLSDTYIVWDSIGVTTSPQESLSDANKSRVRDIYKGIFKKLGLASDSFREIKNLSSSKSVDTSHKVKTTLVKEELPCIDVTFRDGETTAFQFESNESTFVDLKASTREATKLASNIKQCSDIKIRLTAYMARPSCSSKEPDSQLLQKRLEAVKRLLQEADSSLDDDRFELIEGGFVSEADNYECGENGWQESRAKRNRIVRITVI